jgi:hypothetical protein
MAWAVPQFDRTVVDEAGMLLISDDKSVSLEKRNQALEIISNWRSSHGYPLQCLKMLLSSRARKIDQKALIAQRLKRLQSIDAKLRQHSHWMKLTQMQDIGGCRAIVRSVASVEAIVENYKEALRKNKKRSHKFAKENDYICCPKEDGYRSHHLVYRYVSTNKKYKRYNGLKVEIQIRTRLQHAWATAVEIVSALSGQALKSRGGERDWRRFFALMSSAIALRERKPLVPNTPINRVDLTNELRDLAVKLNVEPMLQAWTVSIREIINRSTRNAFAYLLTLDLNKKEISFTEYTKEEMPQATQDYLRSEKQGDPSVSPGIQSVLVSVSSLRSLRKAYPNYFLDASVFLEALQYAMQPPKPRRFLPPRLKTDPRQGKLFPDS